MWHNKVVKKEKGDKNEICCLFLRKKIKNDKGYCIKLKGKI